MGQSDRVDLRSLFFSDDASGERTATMREGHEFTLQRELPEEMRARPVRRPVMGANLQRLVREIVREMLLMELSGHVPGNRACSEQPWWRVRMWEAFWRGRIEAAHSRAMIADSR